MPLTDGQMQLIENIASGIFGALSSIGVQWISTKKSKGETGDEHTETLNKASSENVETAQKINNMLRELMEEERKHFEEEIARAKDACNQEIARMKTHYDSKLETLASDNEALNISMQRLVADNKELNIRVVKLTTDNKSLNDKIVDLKKRLSNYENTTTGEHKAVGSVNNEKKA